MLPFYDALEQDLSERGCRLINTYAQHRWIANFEYYPRYKDLTPESWSEDDFAAAPEGPFVLKGRSSSFKHQWSKLMFASNKEDAIRKAAILRERQVIAQQGLLLRRFIPLETFGQTESGLPIANEWRFFFVRERLIGYGYYWARLAPTVSPAIDPAGISLARECAARAAGHAEFFVVDIAGGGWAVAAHRTQRRPDFRATAIDPYEFYRELWVACR